MRFRVLLFALRKEFIQISRDKMILPMIFIMPVIQLAILPFAADLDVRHLKLIVVDNDKSSYSRQLVNKITSSDLFQVYSMSPSYKEGLKELGKNNADIILQIPSNFERNLIRENNSKVSISADAVNGIKAGLGTSYLNSIIMNFNQQILVKWTSGNNSFTPVDIKYSFWYNPFTNYRTFMVPAILVLLLTTITGFLTALNIVREKEEGTIEQINVTPLKRWQFILSKQIPFLIIGMLVFTVGLLIQRYIYGIHIAGNIFLLYFFTAMYIIGILGFGLLISTISNTQQQSMFVAYFFIMIFILLSGLFTNVESMPRWAFWLSDIIPMTHFMHAVRSIIIKGSEFLDLWKDMVYILAFSFVLNTLSVLKYKKTS